MALLIVAIVVADELQLTIPVMSSVLPSLYVPVAVNLAIVPDAIDEYVEASAIETKAGGLTFITRVPGVALPKLAWIVTLPCATPVTNPPTTVATDVFEEIQVTD